MNAITGIDIIGIVDHSGAGSWRLNGEDLWILRFELLEWKRPGMLIESGRLEVRHKCSHEALKSAMQCLQPLAVVHLRVSAIERSEPQQATADLLEIVMRDFRDTELSERVAGHKVPVFFEDQQFGVFRLDKSNNWFMGTAVWRGATVTLDLRTDAGEAPTEQLTVAKVLWAAQEEWTQRILDYAAHDMLETKNDYWLAEGDPPLDSFEFKQRMILESIGVSSNGEFEFWFDDGDIFWGHSIYVEGNLADGPTRAGFYG